jgi:hypothetical protein
VESKRTLKLKIISNTIIENAKWRYRKRRILKRFVCILVTFIRYNTRIQKGKMHRNSFSRSGSERKRPAFPGKLIYHEHWNAKTIDKTSARPGMRFIIFHFPEEENDWCCKSDAVISINQNL